MNKNTKIWVACSGGVDSIVLAHLLHAQGFQVGLLHCNFHLRAEESDGDEQFVLDFGKKLNVEVRVKHFETPTLVKKRKGNTQIVARDLRYEWFHEVIKEGNNCIALGHHFDDQIETFLIQLERGGGIRGLCAMPKVQGKFIRPLLEKDRAWIITYAHQNKLTWREDSSNASTKYKRNFYRHFLVQRTSFQQGKMETAALINAFQTLQKAIQKAVEVHIETIQSQNFLTTKLWDSLPVLLQKEVLFQLDIPRNQLLSIEKLIKGNIGSTLAYKAVSFVKETKGLSLIVPTSKTYILESKLVQKDEIEFDGKHFYIDADKVKGELSIRPWKEGDRYSPLGLQGSKRVSKYLKDLKISSAQKKTARVITDNEEIIAVEFGNPANRVKISKKTNKVLRLTIREL
ncbi:tRNA(Ile)-lysidine synthase [Lishizhenia tianjinensis]|uniref:tRNA(Ile)-lysidine synthase n=1 Tax=Lishizhenia tianjinensis TaxID=477690 RepID=A0A1I7A5L4_9FLAO|nr:tRNA lysidine(34) synthetase TilS [Lishizhenia tianjinensis]SFT70216.1 tRNA(Ile)-lysidine synthase [Lishizhenia tianjinensis]